jgi:uncharacterized membrane protein YbhN (UPF0104 family)
VQDDRGAKASDGETRKASRDRLHWPAWLRPALAVAIVALAAALLYRTLSRYSFNDIVSSVAAIPPLHVALALLFAAASYFCLSLFDFMATRYAGHSPPYRKVAFASFVSLSLGHNIGFAALSSGTIRYRFYSRMGMRMGEIAKVILFCGATVGLGIATLGGVVLVLRTDLAADVTGLQWATALALGLVCLAAPIAYLVAAATLRRTLHIGTWSVKMPPLKLAIGQVLIGPVNFACVAASLHQSLLGLGDVSYFAVATVYVIANTTALIAHVPGGLGVIETVVLFLLPHAQFIGGLVIFRVVYFLIPLCIGAPAFAIHELVLRRRGAGKR